MPERTDDEIMEEFYDTLRKIPWMHEPKDSHKLAAFLLAHKMIEKAREYLEGPYKKPYRKREEPS